MIWQNQEEGFETINSLGKERVPFLFIISYDKQKIFAQPLNKLDDDILYKLEGQRNYPVQKRTREYSFTKYPVPFTAYYDALKAVHAEIRLGNTYLLNLTFKTAIETNLSLKEIFTFSKAKFKLYFKDLFTCFSPERFVKITGNTIATYPMKGTIDASLPNADKMILTNQKEMAEHVMIVDLMRNDLGIIGTDVKVKEFRYIDKIKAGEKELLQVSSKITAKLPPNWHVNLGEMLAQILPAGSISGTPKKSTLDIINRVENFQRDFYTGVFGIFDGEVLDSGVMIRFIEKEEGELYYKSGGGITIDSDAQDEYEELKDKVYLPL